MYRGLAYTPADCFEGPVGPFVNHIGDIWCKGDDTVTKFVLDWMAHLLQRPGVKMVTTPVLVGPQGAGKGVIVHLLGALLGSEHYIHSNDMKDVVADFQPDKAKTNLLWFLDECLFSGNKQQASQLKALISEPTRRWSAKYVNPIEIKNCSNYIIASNSHTAASVDGDDRRFLCLEVESTYAGPETPEIAAYIKRIRDIPLECVAHYLYNRDISQFNPRAIPNTDYKRFQKAINFTSDQSWISKSLSDGCFRGCYDKGTHDTLDWEKGGGIMSKASLFDSYKAHASDPSHKFNAVLNERVVFKTLKKMTGAQSEKIQIDGKRVCCMVFETLPESREAFKKAVHDENWSFDD